MCLGFIWYITGFESQTSCEIKTSSSSSSSFYISYILRCFRGGPESVLCDVLLCRHDLVVGLCVGALVSWVGAILPAVGGALPCVGVSDPWDVIV